MLRLFASHGRLSSAVQQSEAVQDIIYTLAIKTATEATLLPRQLQLTASMRQRYCAAATAAAAPLCLSVCKDCDQAVK